MHTTACRHHHCLTDLATDALTAPNPTLRCPTHRHTLALLLLLPVLVRVLKHCQPCFTMHALDTCCYAGWPRPCPCTVRFLSNSLPPNPTHTPAHSKARVVHTAHRHSNQPPTCPPPLQPTCRSESYYSIRQGASPRAPQLADQECNFVESWGRLCMRAPSPRQEQWYKMQKVSPISLPQSVHAVIPSTRSTDPPALL